MSDQSSVHRSASQRLVSARRPFGFVSLALVGAISVQAHGQCMYDVTIVQPAPCPDGEVKSLALWAVNNHGEAAGKVLECTLIPHSIPLRWSAGGGLVTLDAPGDPDDTVDIDGINDDGAVVGSYRIEATGRRQAVVWVGAEAIELENSPEGGDAWTEAYGINRHGVIAGMAGQPNSPWRAVLWSGGRMVEIADALPYDSSRARDINDRGVVVGHGSGDDFRVQQGFMLQDGMWTELPVLEGSIQGRAIAVNNRNVAVGFSFFDDDGFYLRPVMWVDGRPIQLGTDHGRANDINDAGQIVGEAEGPAGDYPAMWQNGLVFDVNDLVATPGIEIDDVYSIADSGIMAGDGEGFGPNGYSKFGVILTPIGSAEADVNIDCRVDEADLAILLEDWGQSELPTDIDEDGVVGPRDLAILLSQWSGS